MERGGTVSLSFDPSNISSSFSYILSISPVTMSMHKIRHVSGMRPLYVRLSLILSRYITLVGDRNGIMNCHEDREQKARYVSMFRW